MIFNDLSDFKPKHSIRNEEKFQRDRANLGNLIHEGMNTTGGTDIDWLIERNGNFIVMENKSFSEDTIVIPWGQLIAFEKLHEKLNSDGKCYFLVFGYDEGLDYNNEESKMWYFEMTDWKQKKIPFVKERKLFLIKRQDMYPINLREYRELMEKYWHEFS